MVKEVLGLYSDCSDEVKNLLNKALCYLVEVDNEAFIKYANGLCNLKRNYPDFMIKITDDEKSCFQHTNGIIRISRDSQNNFWTLFHELTHAFHYYTSGYFIPEEFWQLVDELKTSQGFDENCVTLLRHLEEKNRIEKNDEDTTAIVEKSNNEDSQIRENSDEEANIVRFYQVLVYVEDIIDAIYGGELHDYGLCYEKDNMKYVEKTATGSGHGREYYARKSSVYREILADYGVIRNSQFKDELLKILTMLVGERLMGLLESEYLKVINVPRDMMDIDKNEIGPSRK